MRKQIANIITGCRILCSILILFCPVFSIGFYIIYLFCGFTDMIDGTVARKTNAVSEFGTKFDTVADFIFVTVCLIKLLPAIHPAKWLWNWIGVIAVIKISNNILSIIINKKIVSLHTIANKITGFILFLLPLSIPLIDLQYSAPAVCLTATFSAIQEGYYIIKH